MVGIVYGAQVVCESGSGGGGRTRTHAQYERVCRSTQESEMRAMANEAKKMQSLESATVAFLCSISYISAQQQCGLGLYCSDLMSGAGGW